MRGAFAILFVLLVSAVLAAAQVNPEWIKYTSAEGRYSVSLPQPPTLSTRDSNTASGQRVPQFVAMSGDRNGGFRVTYYDYRRGMTFSLDQARDSMVTNLHATLLGEGDISLGGLPGKQLKFLAKADNGLEFLNRARLYDISRRIYVLQCIFLKTEDGPAVMDKCEKFFDSFKVQNGR